MDLQDFRRLEAKLGHPPTEKEVREEEAKKHMCAFTTPECTKACYAKPRTGKKVTSTHFRIHLN
jgi:hypothetical protein